MNTLRPNDVFETNIKGIGAVKVPYLNGELFEQKEVDKAKSRFPQKYFHDLLNLFLQYNFTIDENDPNDAEIGVDPEMLGKIFENLLEDNKDKGAFYTPKEIVRYMCKKSLISYLCSHVAVKHESIKALVNNHQLTDKLQEDVNTCKQINKFLQDVKVCDPAIGSGAFPMGVMNEIFSCRRVLHDNIEEDVTAETQAQIKRDIIQNNIYGVDIEQGAVDIARLRFWLALVVDSVQPEPLPNLDYKIMQGNSLIESYKGLDLSNLLHNEVLFVSTKSQELPKLLRAYYRETDNEAKRKLRNEIDFTIKQYIYLAGYQDTVEIPNSDFFLWHTYFQEVFKDSGFDIVIGNPPYISAPDQIANRILVQQRENIIKSKKYSSLYQKWDLYIPFIENGIHLAAPKGIITMIVPYPLTNQTYGKKLRELILQEYTLFELCDLNGTKIFNNATVSNCIPFISKEFNSENKTIAISHIHDGKSITLDYEKTVQQLMPDAKTSVWYIEEKARDTSRHDDMHILGDYCYISVGMVLNADEKKAKGEFSKEDLISETRDAVHNRPYIEAKDISKYRINNIRYLEYDTVRCPSKLRRPTFRELYERDKLIFNRLGNLQVMIDNEVHYLQSDSSLLAIKWCDLANVENKSISSSIKKFSRLPRTEMECLSENVDLRFLLGVMNSNYAKNLLADLRSGDYHIYPEHIRNFPIPNATIEQQRQICSLVDYIINIKRTNKDADTTALEINVDKLVFHLYGLTYDEVKIVDPKTPITEEEYNKQ